VCSLDAEVVFQSQGNIDPPIWHTPILILIFGSLVAGALLNGVLRVPVERLDIVECFTFTSIKRLGSHWSNTIDARELPQSFIPFVFEKRFCDMLTDRQAMWRFGKLTGFYYLTVLQVLPDLVCLSEVSAAFTTLQTPP